MAAPLQVQAGPSVAEGRPSYASVILGRSNTQVQHQAPLEKKKVVPQGKLVASQGEKPPRKSHMARMHERVEEQWAAKEEAWRALLEARDKELEAEKASNAHVILLQVEEQWAAKEVAWRALLEAKDKELEATDKELEAEKASNAHVKGELEKAREEVKEGKRREIGLLRKLYDMSQERRNLLCHDASREAEEKVRTLQSEALVDKAAAEEALVLTKAALQDLEKSRDKVCLKFQDDQEKWGKERALWEKERAFFITSKVIGQAQAKVSLLQVEEQWAAMEEAWSALLEATDKELEAEKASNAHVKGELEKAREEVKESKWREIGLLRKLDDEALVDKAAAEEALQLTKAALQDLEKSRDQVCLKYQDDQEKWGKERALWEKEWAFLITSKVKDQAQAKASLLQMEQGRLGSGAGRRWRL